MKQRPADLHFLYGCAFQRLQAFLSQTQFTTRPRNSTRSRSGKSPLKRATLAFLSRWSDKMLSAAIKLFMAVFSRRHFSVPAAGALIKFRLIQKANKRPKRGTWERSELFPRCFSESHVNDRHELWLSSARMKSDGSRQSETRGDRISSVCMHISSICYSNTERFGRKSMLFR